MPASEIVMRTITGQKFRRPSTYARTKTLSNVITRRSLFPFRPFKWLEFFLIRYGKYFHRFVDFYYQGCCYDIFSFFL